MQRLTARDAEQVLRFVAGAESFAGDDPFTPTLLAELGRLVEADRVAYCEQDRVRQQIRLEVGRVGDPLRGHQCTYWDIAAEHPLCAHHNTGDVRALKLSDFLGSRAFHRSRIYAVWFAPSTIEHELIVAIPSPPWHTKTFLFDRERRDFTERDRLVLDLLQPHLGRLWRAARTRRSLRVALQALEQGSSEGARGVVLVAPDGGVEYVSPRARSLIAEYLDGRAGSDPLDSLADWIGSGRQAFTRRRGRNLLMVERSGDALLLEERRDTLGLTARERQVLAWAARGKTNKEIAQTLTISPGTVRRHLENTYRKLGVGSRTAAAARFLAVLSEAERRAAAGPARQSPDS